MRSRDLVGGRGEAHKGYPGVRNLLRLEALGVKRLGMFFNEPRKYKLDTQSN
jgi:hypothetical protein